MSKELIERLRLMSADTYGNDAADALESLEADRDSWERQAGDRLDDVLRVVAERDALANRVYQLEQKNSGAAEIIAAMQETHAEDQAELKALREQEPPADIDPHDAMLQKQHDEAQGPLANAAHKVYFRAGLLACREHMARFVESQDPSIAASIRANWWPDLGPDMGPPRRIEWGELTEGEYGESGFRVKEPHEISPTIEALPIAQHFLTPDEGTTK